MNDDMQNPHLAMPPLPGDQSVQQSVSQATALADDVLVNASQVSRGDETTSSIDEYFPPDKAEVTAESTMPSEPLVPMTLPDAPIVPVTPSVTEEPAMSATPATPVAPVLPEPIVSATPAGPVAQSETQALEDQNIFFLLGVNDGTEEEREEFLDELQEVIWDEFVESDVPLLITEEETVGFKAIQNNLDLEKEEKQEQLVVYLEKLVPDLESILLEKALKLKEDMVRERISGMRQYFHSKAEDLATIDQAEVLMNEGRWKDAADKLNAMQY